MKIRLILTPLLLLFSMALIAQETADLTEEQQYQQWQQKVMASLVKRTGEIELKSAGAKLTVPDNFYFYLQRMLKPCW